MNSLLFCMLIAGTKSGQKNIVVGVIKYGCSHSGRQKTLKLAIYHEEITGINYFFNGDTNSGYVEITGLAWSKVGVAPFTS